eukprot:snap_masked-scaffold_27-processed-gene-2.45-mRNA-1 protein AED:1.00 eAED:1.00 QI:0/-1/0/0/-1/1/1/0/67
MKYPENMFKKRSRGRLVLVAGDFNTQVDRRPIKVDKKPGFQSEIIPKGRFLKTSLSLTDFKSLITER